MFSECVTMLVKHAQRVQVAASARQAEIAIKAIKPLKQLKRAPDIPPPC
jgi:hypothetical protein